VIMTDEHLDVKMVAVGAGRWIQTRSE